MSTDSVLSNTLDIPTDFEDGLDLPRTYTQGSMVNIESDVEGYVTDNLNRSYSSQDTLDDLDESESFTKGSSAASQSHLNFDAVTCTGVPVLHCVRVMCSFLLQGQPGCILPDSQTRVSVKALALTCICSALKIFPEAFVAKVLPDDIDGSENAQLVRDILLFITHEDPHLRGLVAASVSSFISCTVKQAGGDFTKWIEKVADIYKTGTKKLFVSGILY